MPEEKPEGKVEVIHFDQRVDNAIRLRGRKIYEFARWLRDNGVIATKCISACTDPKAIQLFSLIRAKDENKAIVDVKVPAAATDQLLAIEDITRAIKSKGCTIVNQNISKDPDNDSLCVVKFLITLA